MEIFNYLLALYATVVLTNVLAGFLLWKGTGTALYRTLAVAWLLGLGTLLAGGITSGMSLLAQTIGFSSCFLFTYWISKPLAQLAEVKLPRLPLVAMLAGSLLAAVTLQRLGAPSALVTAPVALVTGLPLVYVGSVAILRRWKNLSLTLRCYAVTSVIAGLHQLDYIYFQGRLDLVAVGFTVGLALAVAFTLFAPGAILERVAAEKTSLELHLSYKAKVSNAAKLSALGEMAGGIAHEINNPLAILKVLLNQMHEMATGARPDSARLVQSCQRADETVDRIARIVTGLRGFARDGSRDPLTPEPVDRIIEGTLALCQEKFRSLGIHVDVRNPEPSLEVVCRPVEISQILLNLLNNSTDAVLVRSEKWIRIQVRHEGPRAEIEVTDSGTGVPPEIRERIFQPFFTTKAVGHGTGLGLSISRGIAEAHGGSLSLAPEESHTRFVLSLPAA